ncbi:MAG: diaminopropionate ammonia-lyase [Negativicutes bacterium]|nr:diaminopropionate ammonia-lyase [Negativicutes bacterium]
MNKFRCIANRQSNSRQQQPDWLNLEAAGTAQRFHSSFPHYQPTPLLRLSSLAKHCGVAEIWLKDESYRFGLNAFKVLGGSFAIGSYLAERLHRQVQELCYEELISETVRQQLGEITFVTATDGNHGRGVAWTAAQLGQAAVVYLPKGSSQERLQRIRETGAKAEITELNYDQAVRLAKRKADQNGWVVVQDTAWPGYEQIPCWIMQGYTTMALEALQQLNGSLPSHIFIQAGVGSLAAAMIGFFRQVCAEAQPVCTVVEADAAACLYRTVKADDGALHFVDGDLKTIMAGLACGEPNPLAWPILQSGADWFASISDAAAAEGMRILGNPLCGDHRVISGESGAAGFAFAMQLLLHPRNAVWRSRLGLDAASRVLVFSTEGDTDAEQYRRIVW